MTTTVACPKCHCEIGYDAAQHGPRICCPQCSSVLDMTGPAAIRCPRCQSDYITAPQKKLSGAGLAVMIIGILLAPVGVGIVAILCAYLFMRETKYQCGRCQLWF